MSEPASRFTDEDRARVEKIAANRGLPPEDRADLRAALAYIDKLESALRLIAAPPRPDGTYNRDREACEQLARAALDQLKEPVPPAYRDHDRLVGDREDDEGEWFWTATKETDDE